MGFVMFVDNGVVKEVEGELIYDKFAIASTSRLFSTMPLEPTWW